MTKASKAISDQVIDSLFDFLSDHFFPSFVLRHLSNAPRWELKAFGFLGLCLEEFLLGFLHDSHL